MVWISIAIFAAIVIVVIVFAIKRREEVFEGEVIDKNVIETMNNNMPMNSTNNMNNMNNGFTIINRGSGNVQHSYTIKVKTSAGKTIDYGISSGMYEIIKIGDTVSKAKGTTEIVILSSKPVIDTPVSNPVATNSTPPSSTPESFV